MMKNPAGKTLRGFFYGLLRTVHRRGSRKSSLISCCLQTSMVMIGIESYPGSCDEVGAQVRLFCDHTDDGVKKGIKEIVVAAQVGEPDGVVAAARQCGAFSHRL